MTTNKRHNFIDALEELDAPKPKKSATRAPIAHPNNYVAAALKDELATLASTGEGRRNDQLNISALKLARLPLDLDELREQLIDACHTNGLVADDGIRSVERTIDSAYSKADADGPRGIPDKPASWEPVDDDVELDVDGAELLDDLLATLKRYVVLPDQHSYVAVTLWIATTHALPAFECAPRLVATSPDKRCGKSRLLDIITATCHRSLATVNASTAAVFRSIGGEHPPTLVIDEADTIFGSKRVAENNEDLRALLNAGHQRGRPVLRCVGPDLTPKQFQTFAMAALAGIGRMPDTITDRAVNVRMRRRAQHEVVASFRSRRDGPLLAKMQKRLAAWAAHHLDALSMYEPDLPVEDRAADTWEPLVAVADLAGEHWPATARSACSALVNEADETEEDQSLGVKLLGDVRQIFDERMSTFLPSADLITELRKFEESPWNDFDLNPNKLARRLADFGIKPGRNPAGSIRGYSLETFSDAFARYLRQEPSEPSETRPEQDKPTDALEASDGSKRQEEKTRQGDGPAHATYLTHQTDSDVSAPTTNHTCQFCDADLPEHMTSQRARGYCGRAACLGRAGETT